MQDDLQAFRLHQMNKCIVDLQIPCRWVPDMGYQYGYPQFNFYSPSVFYLGELIHLTGVQIIDSVKILFILGFILAGFSMFLLIKSLTGENWPALVGALLYTYVPFKAAQVYVRGSLNEFWSFVFFPLIFWSIYQLIKTKQNKYIIFLGLATSLMLLTHNLMSVLIAPLAVIWGLNWLILERGWRAIFKLFAGLALGVGLSAFFILPVIFEGKFVHLETLIGGYFDYRQHFVSFSQLFFSNYFGYGSSVFGTKDEVSLSVGIIQWVTALIGALLALVYFKKNKRISITALVLLVLSLPVIFLMHQRSSFIWSSFEFFKYFQFPWRFLAGSSFLLSIIGAIGVYLIPNKKISALYGGLIIALLFYFYISFFKPLNWIDTNDKEKFSGKEWERQLTVSIFDYLPIYAVLPPNKKAPDYPEVLEGEVDIKEYKKGSNYQVGEVNVLQEAVIRLPLLDFPGMKVYVNNQEVSHWHDDCRGQKYCMGLITFKIPVGSHKIEARLTNTPVRTVGNVTSLLTILGLSLILVKNFYEKRHH